jgi:hypothetical protein
MTDARPGDRGDHADPSPSGRPGVDELVALRVEAAPRRTEAAFARAVAADVAAARARWRFALPVFGAAAAAAVVVVVARPVAPVASTADVAAALEARAAQPALAADLHDRDAADDGTDGLDGLDGLDVADAVVVLDDRALLALAGDEVGSAPDFAFEALDGSTGDELDAVEAALDDALARKL